MACGCEPDGDLTDLDRLTEGKRPLGRAGALASRRRMIASVSAVASASPWPARA